MNQQMIDNAGREMMLNGMRHTPVRKSTNTFHYTLNGVDLECEMDYESAAGDGYHEPRESETATLCEAFCGGIDIIEILSDDQREEIEIAYLEQDRSNS